MKTISRLLVPVLLTAFLMLASFIAGRTRSKPAPPDLPFEPDGVAMLMGKRLDWELDKIPLGELVELWRSRYGVAITAEWKELEPFGIDSRTTLSLHARQIQLHEAVTLLTTEDRGSAQLALMERGNMLVLTSEDNADRHAVTRMYDLRTLHRRMYGRDFEAPEFTTAPAFGNPSTTQATGGLFDASEDAHPSRADSVEQITTIIRETVARDSWKEDGGRIGSLREAGGFLIVRTTPIVHQELRRKLNEMALHPEEFAIWTAPSTQPAGER